MWVPSGRWTWAVQTDNCATDFSKNFAEKSFLFKSFVWTVRHCRPDSLTLAVSNFLIRLQASGPRGMSVRTAKLQHPISIFAIRTSGSWKAVVRTVEVKSAISLTVERTSRPRLTVIRMVIFELRFFPYVRARPDGNPRHPDGWSNLPLNELGKNLKLIDHWEASERAAETSGRMQARTEASRYSGASRRKVHVVRTDDA